MTDGSRLTRRDFLRATAAGGLMLATSAAWAEQTVRPKGKTVLSFYCDDTVPYPYPPDTFKRFLDFVSAEGIAGESTVLTGSGGTDHPLSRPATDLEKAYIEQLHRAYACGIDSHMELMTHGALYDFAKGRPQEGAEHEGIWLSEPAVSVQTYEDYFGHILAEGERIGVRFTGVTWPGCSCEACTRRTKELGKDGHLPINPNVWQALLNLAKQGKFRGHTVPCFVAGENPRGEADLKAKDGRYRVYDLEPNVGDMTGSYTNSTDRVSADYYITADGEKGRVVEAVRAGAPFCIFYAHWQGLNPAKGVGWGAFCTVVHRIRQHLADQVVWMRPSQYTESLA